MPMRKNLLYIVLFFLAVLVVWVSFSFAPQPDRIDLPATHGSYDLTKYDFKNTIYRTADYWESWPEKLYTPKDFSNGIVPVSMNLAAVKEINKQAGADVNITATRMSNRKLKGSVSVAIPYTLGAGENADNVQAAYVDVNGKVQ